MDSSEVKKDNQDLLSELIVKIAHTREFHYVVGTLVPEVTKIWAGTSKVKKFFSKPVEKSFQKSFVNESVLPSETVNNLFNDELITSNISKLVPSITSVINFGLMGLNDISQTIEKLSSHEKAKMVSEIFTKINSEDIAKIINSYIRIINDIYQTEPNFFANHVSSGFATIYEKVDFGEIRDFADNLSPDVIELVKKINDEIWKYPAKFVLLLSLIPFSLNLGTSSLNVILKGFNQMAPDLFVDILFSFLKELNTKEIGTLLSEISEVLNKINTGSSLIGEPGKPQMPYSLFEFFDGIFKSIEKNALDKGIDSVAQMKNHYNNAFFDVMENHPEILALYYKHKSLQSEASRLSSKKRINLLSNSSDSLFSKIIDKMSLNSKAGDLGEIFNSLISVMSKLRKTYPNIIQTTIEEFTDSIDVSEAQETINWFFEEAGDAIKPFAKSVMPSAINFVTNLITQDGDENDSAISEALMKLKSVLNNGGI
ncbi:MAG: hypothetical protein HQK76_02530 [Desulfobacterales bacterium]|nr:hypothetical protein [Desulfobacterales bacterium]